MRYLFCVQDPANIGRGAAGTNVAAQIYVDVFEARFSSQAGALLCLGFNVTALLLCAPALCLRCRAAVAPCRSCDDPVGRMHVQRCAWCKQLYA